MEQITAGRTGEAPLVFHGETVVEATSREGSGWLHNRWHEIYVWSIDGRPTEYVTSVRYVTQWEGEHNHTASAVMKDVVRWLRTIDPCEHVMGYPPGPQFEAKQGRLMRELRAGYDRAVSEVAVHWPEMI